MLEEPEAESLRREVENDGGRPEVAELLERIPPVRMHEKPRAVSPDVALAVVVSPCSGARIAI